MTSPDLDTNLIPRDLRRLRVRRIRTRFWMIACGSYLTAVALGSVAILLVPVMMAKQTDAKMMV